MDAKQDYSMRLKNQLCFPLYATSREVIKLYKPYLDSMGLTYTQYIVMVLLWEHKTLTVKELGDPLFLDSGTLTPLLKKLEAKGYITRTRSTKDERNLNVSITPEGMAIEEQAKQCAAAMDQNNKSPLTHEETMTLYCLLYKMLGYENPDLPDWA